jgi:hypothetical protein
MIRCLQFLRRTNHPSSLPKPFDSPILPWVNHLYEMFVLPFHLVINCALGDQVLKEILYEMPDKFTPSITITEIA